jgi:hypothetical protein
MVTATATRRSPSWSIPERRGAPKSIPERRVLEIWQSSVQRRPDLVTAEYGPVSIVYPGRPNDGRGADLKDAVILTGRGVLKGDIEIHVKASDWRAHGHHLDPEYNRVILHVVLQNDAGSSTVLQDGAAIPTLSLDSFAEIQPARRVSTAFTPVFAPPCKAGPEAASILAKAGEARFSGRVKFFLDGITKSGPGETLYRGIMTALGYSRNKESMAALASLVPLRETEELLAGAETGSAILLRVQSRLFGVAGLLPLPGSRKTPAVPVDPFEIELEQLRKRQPPAMSVNAWQFFKVRPGNSPVRRIAGMGYLLVRFREQGILSGLREALENGEDGRAMEQALEVNADGYWGRHPVFSATVAGQAPALIGRDRAAEIIINIVLPFFTAYGCNAGQPPLSDKARAVFNSYRPPPENSLEKHVRKQLGLPPETTAAAPGRQGLIHIYKTFCTQGKCGECPFGR